MDAKFGLSLGGRGGREALVPTNSIMSQQSGEGDPDISRDVDLIDRFIFFGEVSFLLLFALSLSLSLSHTHTHTLLGALFLLVRTRPEMLLSKGEPALPGRLRYDRVLNHMLLVLRSARDPVLEPRSDCFWVHP